MERISAFSTRKLIEDTISSEHPATVRHLATLVMAERPVDEDDFVGAVKEMVREGVISLTQPSYDIRSPLDYLFALPLSGWFWATVCVTVLTLVVALTPDLVPLNILRWLLGSVFVLFLPGYAVLQFLWPQNSRMDRLERFALNIGVSLGVSPVVGFLLSFTPWGIRLVPVLGSLGAFTVVVSIAAAIRKYWSLRSVPLV